MSQYTRMQEMSIVFLFGITMNQYNMKKIGTNKKRKGENKNGKTHLNTGNSIWESFFFSLPSLRINLRGNYFEIKGQMNAD